jgi:tRNA A-37 threonylcarbamoyl transferase component Bud32
VIDRYEFYCLADTAFYDTLDRAPGDHPDFDACARPLPDGWQHEATDTWMHYAPRDASLPVQGWKVHLSARMADLERVLDTVWEYCVPRGIAFKFLRSRPVAMMFNAKSAGRGSSGKLVTIYPADVSQLELVLKDLDALLAGVRGPYILSDLRYGEGPVFVRYGAFAEQHCLADNGQRVLAMYDADGALVPDTRGPTFTVPPWVALPAFLEPHLAARNAVTTTGLPYDIDSVLHFSNGGGVYLGRDRRTGDRVVLKEGRPYAGLDVAGRDAVERLAAERAILDRLSGVDAAPQLVDFFTLGDHRFLVQEFIDGTALQRLVVHKYPLTRADRDQDMVAEYTTWAVEILRKVQHAVAALHGRGVVFGDLHPDNILVTGSGRIVFVDYEVSTLVRDRSRSTLAHPGFVAPADRDGVDVDRYALACLWLYLFAPQTTFLLTIDRAKAAHLAELIAAEFPVPAADLDAAVATILGTDRAGWVPDLPLPQPDPGTWPAVRAAIRRAIVASATPERDDRLFPGDIAQFQPGGGINLAHGAAGVLYALAVTGAGRFPEYENWLRARALTPERGTGPGCYDGLLGVAYVLDLLGHRRDALDAVALCGSTWDGLELGLYAGLSGIGLALLHLGDRTGEAELTAEAVRIVDRCAERLGGPHDVPERSGGDDPRAGLLYGSSGPALLFLRAYERGGDPALLDLAEVALRQDLRRCTRTRDGSLQVNQGWRTLPYLDEGSVGIGLVLARYLAYRPDEEFAAALRDTGLAATAGYYVQPGLFTGRAGILAGLGLGLAPGGETHGQVERLAWHALPYGGGLAFAGNYLLRLSMDLATGSAGILLALGTALHDEPVSLPFLPPVGTPASRGGRPLSLLEGR